jgi:hypothetical protein
MAVPNESVPGTYQRDVTKDLSFFILAEKIKYYDSICNSAALLGIKQ